MGAFSGPKLPTSSLLFAYDQDNFKSHPGEPITNVVTNTNLNTGWSKGYTINNNLDDTSVSKPPGVPADTPVVSFTRYTTSTSCFWYSYGDYAPQADNTTYYISVWVRTLGQDFPINAYTADNGETDRKSTTYITVVGDDTWQRIEWPAITTANPTDSDSLSFRLYLDTSAGNYPPLDQTIYLCAPQMTTTRHTGYVEGTRSTTEAVLDWAGGNTMTEVNMVFGDGTFSFESTTATRLTVADTSYPVNWTDPFSLEIWTYCATGDVWNDSVTFGANSGTALVGRGSYAGCHGLFRNSVDNRITFSIRTDAAIYGAALSSLARDTWHHVVGVWDGTNNKIYHNGEYITQSTPTWTSATADTGAWQIGGNVALGGTNGGYIDGEIPVARMYNKALSAGEVKQCYHSLKGRFGL